MKTACLLSLAATLQAFAATRCSDVPISVTFLATTVAPAAIWNDLPNTAYQDGKDGVTAVIQLNSDCVHGTHDATLTLAPRSKRTLNMQFPAAIPGSLIQSGPAPFAGGAPFAAQAHINVHNITGYTALPPGVAATFYTTVGSTLTGPDGNSYQLRFHPDSFTCPAGSICAPDLEGSGNASNMNQPVETAWAQVTYTPRDRSKPWSSTNTDSWVVDGEYVTDGIIQRSTLFLNGKTCCSTQTHYGQYSMPFKILIVALAPLP